MNIKTVQQVIAENSSYKASSLYAAILNAIKSGGLAGKALPINRNDANSKFRLPKTKAKTRGAGREVTNFVLIDLPAFDAWFEASKAGIRTMIALNRTQVVMPRLEEIVAGKYTSEQLSELAAHVANRRYGTKSKKDKTSSTQGRGRPRKVVEVAAPVKVMPNVVAVKAEAVKAIPAKLASKKPVTKTPARKTPARKTPASLKAVSLRPATASVTSKTRSRKS
jgi:hypothetical protein